MRPPRTQTMSWPSTSMRAPLGAKPMNRPGPANVPRARQRTAARSPSATTSSTSKRQSGNASNTSAKKAAAPSGPVGPTTPWICPRPPGA